MASPELDPVRIFISYSHRNEAAKNRLVVHLTVLQRVGLIAQWDDRLILAASEWEPAIQKELDRADVILLLISADFVASDFCWAVEMQQAIERHEKGTAKVIPVFLEPCEWKGAPFDRLQGVPMNARPISMFDNHEDAYAEVTRSIRQVVVEWSKTTRVPAILENAIDRTRQIVAELSKSRSITPEKCNIRILARISSFGLNIDELNERESNDEYRKLLMEERRLLEELSSFGAAIQVLLNWNIDEICKWTPKSRKYVGMRLTTLMEFIRTGTATNPNVVFVHTTLHDRNILLIDDRILFEGRKVTPEFGFQLTKVVTDRLSTSNEIEVFDQKYLNAATVCLRGHLPYEEVDRNKLLKAELLAKLEADLKRLERLTSRNTKSRSVPLTSSSGSKRVPRGASTSRDSSKQKRS
jgi:hypothetical protein